MLILMHTAELPWSPLEDPRVWTPAMIERKKEEVTIKELCKNVPEAFTKYFQHIQKLGFYDKPDYPKLRKLFQDALWSNGGKKDYVFDWTERMWRELYPPTPEPSRPALAPT